MNRNGGLVRRTCGQSVPSRGVWGQKLFKIQGVSGAFSCDFGTYELRAQLTSAHTQTLRVRIVYTRTLPRPRRFVSALARCAAYPSFCAEMATAAENAPKRTL